MARVGDGRPPLKFALDSVFVGSVLDRQRSCLSVILQPYNNNHSTTAENRGASHVFGLGAAALAACITIALSSKAFPRGEWPQGP
jgi:hypothetical protein